jgi:hypothetical protein
MGPSAFYRWITVVCLTMKPVGKPDVGNPHVRFDERGWETERLAMPQATAPILDSTGSAQGCHLMTERKSRPTASALLEFIERGQRGQAAVDEALRLAASMTKQAPCTKRETARKS